MKANACSHFAGILIGAVTRVGVGEHQSGVVRFALVFWAAVRAGVPATHLAERVPLCPFLAPVGGGCGGRGWGHALTEATGNVVKISGYGHLEERVPVESNLQAKVCLQDKQPSQGEDVDFSWAQLQR